MDLCGGDRLAEVVTLGHGDDGVGDGWVIEVGIDIAHEGLIDLELWIGMRLR